MKSIPVTNKLSYEARLKLPYLYYRRQRGDTIETYKYITAWKIARWLITA